MNISNTDASSKFKTKQSGPSKHCRLTKKATSLSNGGVGANLLDTGMKGPTGFSLLSKLQRVYSSKTNAVVTFVFFLFFHFPFFSILMILHRICLSISYREPAMAL